MSRGDGLPSCLGPARIRSSIVIRECCFQPPPAVSGHAQDAHAEQSKARGFGYRVAARTRLTSSKAMAPGLSPLSPPESVTVSLPVPWTVKLN